MTASVAGEPMPFDDPRKAASFGDTSDVDTLSLFEQFHGEGFTWRQRLFAGSLEFAQMSHGLYAYLAKIAPEWFACTTGLRQIANLDRVVAIARRCPDLQYRTGPNFDCCAGDQGSVWHEELCHP
jgi:hypothetical protein